ncbi:MAG: ABC transporter permease [Verrucomicrobiae bacterium]|nr:ABC transporter permease [Verrucomicrobiae bacterium]
MSTPATSLWRTAWQQLRRNRLAMVCLGVIAFYALVALTAEGIYWYYRLTDQTPPYKQVNFDNRFAKPSLRHPLGTDSLGRDVLLQVIQGTRIAFEVGILTSLIAIPIAVILGALAGYYGRRVDDFIVWLYTVFDSIPGLLFILAIAIVVGKGLLGVCLGIGLTTWVGLCRLIRGEYIKHRDRQYVLAARALGVNNFAIMFRHILPNVLHLVIISFSLRFPGAILTEVVLSYLGVGVQGEPSWGIMISDAKLRLWQGHWWELAGATAAMFFIVLAFNLFGDALRDALDPKLRTAEAKTA